MRNPPDYDAIEERLAALAVNLDHLMHAHHLSEKGLASMCSLAPRTVGNFLRPQNRFTHAGTVKAYPSGTIANLMKIAQALDVEAWELMCPCSSFTRRAHAEH